MVWLNSSEEGAVRLEPVSWNHVRVWIDAAVGGSPRTFGRYRWMR